MVGQTETSYLAWIWLHQILGWKHVHFLQMEMDEYGNIFSHQRSQQISLPSTSQSLIFLPARKYYHPTPNDSPQSHSASTDTSPPSLRPSIPSDGSDNEKGEFSYTLYLQICYVSHRQIVELICAFVGHLNGWKEPWICHSEQRNACNIKMYRRMLIYPSNSLMDDERNEESKRFMQQHNKENILSDSILVCTKTSGYWLGNMVSGNWYELGFESPFLENLYVAMQRGSMSCDLFPRSDKLFLAGGLVCSMPISTVVKLELSSMRLSWLNEMENPRAYLAMTFFPDSLLLIGGSNCWDRVYSRVEQFDLTTNRWQRLASLNCARSGHSAVTINERYVFVTGGCDRFHSVMSCELYDRKSNQWTMHGSMMKPVQKCHALKYKDDLFVVGAKDRTVR